MGPKLTLNVIHVDMGESCADFYARPSKSENLNFWIHKDHLNSEDPTATFSTSHLFTTTPPFNIATADGGSDYEIDVYPAGPDL